MTVVNSDLSAGNGAPDGFQRLYRALVARVHTSHGFWVLVTSARSGEGVTTVASGLARAIAEEEDVLYCRIAPGPFDPDLGRIGLPFDPAGLSAGAPLRGDGLRGRLYYFPEEFGSIAADVQGVRRLRERFRFGVIDAAPVLASPACLKLAGAVDGAVVVIEAAATSWRSAKDAVEALQSSGVTPLGLVLNKLRPDLPLKWARRLGEPTGDGKSAGSER